MIGQWIEVEAPANIALIKYWGKKNEDLIIPLNDSLSLSIDSLQANTRIEIIEGAGRDSVSINGSTVKTILGSRFEKCFDEAKKVSNNSTSPFSFKVESTTTFPVAAGLASSAAGFAAIAFALGNLLQFSNKNISRIARIGSGSACRSVSEGLVHWKAGSDPSGEDCFSETLFRKNHWPDLKAIILILNENEKEIGSTVGMKNTAETSELLKYRITNVVPDRVKRLIDAYKNKRFTELAMLTMADSNQFHAVCLDTTPPLKYMNDLSWEVVKLTEEFNKNEIKAAYSFDAGPNACIFLSKEHVPAYLEIVSTMFHISDEVREHLKTIGYNLKSAGKGSSITNIIVSDIGIGPRIISRSQ